MVGIVIILGIILLVPAPVGIDDAKMKKRKIYCCMVFGAMFLFAALRGESVAIDNANRYRMITEALQYGFTDSLRFLLQSSEREVVYAFVVWLISRIAPSPHIITMVFDGFILYTFGKFFYRHADDLKIASLLYFAFSFSASLNITRQYLACAVFLWAIECILNDKKLKSVLLIAVAVMFHTSAIVLFAIYFLFIFDLKITKSRLFLVSIGAVGMFFAFDRLSTYIVDRFLPQYSWYLRGQWAVGDAEFSVLWLIIYFLIAVGLYFCIGGKNTIEKKDECISPVSADKITRERIFCIMSVFYIIYALISMLISKVWFFGRMKCYFCIGYYFVVGNVFSRFPYLSARDKSMLRLVFIAGIAVWSIMMYKTDGNGLFPYVFFWE